MKEVEIMKKIDHPHIYLLVPYPEFNYTSIFSNRFIAVELAFTTAMVEASHATLK